MPPRGGIPVGVRIDRRTELLETLRELGTIVHFGSFEEQIRGDAELNFDRTKGEVRAPWLSWGPYLWANGDRPRSDGFAFAYDDFRENDRMHHSAAGMQKMGAQLLNFFKNDATTKSWFLKAD